jgi:hypothetical protein
VSEARYLIPAASVFHLSISAGVAARHIRTVPSLLDDRASDARFDVLGEGT